MNVEFVARSDDLRAEDQFRQILRTLHAAPAAPDPIAAALESVAAPASLTRPAGAVAFDLPLEFRGPSSAVLASPDRRARVEVAAFEPLSSPAVHPLLGTLATAIGDDGKPVRYAVAPVRPQAAAAGFEAVPAADAATGEIERHGRRLQVTGRVTDDPAAARDLVRAVLDRATPRPE